MVEIFGNADEVLFPVLSPLLLPLAGASVAMIVGSAALAPWLLARLPADYFRREKPHLLARLRAASPTRAALLLLKNLAGTALLTAGVIMLFLPGQGLLTIVAGLMLIDFPRKFDVERWLVGRGKVLQTINWLRQRQGRAPLELDD